MTRMAAAIIISFGCYLPVTLFSKNKTKSRTINDSEDLCIYVDYCNGTTDFVGILKMRWKTAKYRMWL